jgi:hypothetical protein
MRTILIVLSAIGLMAAGGAQAQKLDANGRCHAANGQFAKAEVCAGAAPAKASKSAKAAVAPAAAEPPARAAQPARCKDAKGKFAKCGSPGAHPA